MSDRTRWQATSAWTHAAISAIGGPDLSVECLDPVALATIVVRKGSEAALRARLEAHLGCPVPDFGEARFGSEASLIWSAPGQWLAVGTSAALLDSLPAAVDGLAAVTDQTDSRALVKISGARARDALARGFAIDLHPTLFSTGSAAVTKVAHLSVQIWQTDAAPTYVIAVPRSFVSTFWSWLTSACQPFAET